MQSNSSSASGSHKGKKPALCSVESVNKAEKLAIAHKLWAELEPKINELTPSEVVSHLHRYDFKSINKASSHFKLQPPALLAELGSFTLTSSLSRFLLKKMMVKNFENFFARFFSDDVASAPSPILAKEPVASKSQEVLTPFSAHTLQQASVASHRAPNPAVTPQPSNSTGILHAYSQPPEDKEEYWLKKVLLIFEDFSQSLEADNVKYKKQFFSELQALEQRLVDYPRILVILYLEWLDLFESLEDSQEILRKIVKLYQDGKVQQSSILRAHVPLHIYFYYLDYANELTESLKQEGQNKSMYYDAVDNCLGLHLHLLTMLSPPIKLIESKYPIIPLQLPEGIDGSDWLLAAASMGLSFISTSVLLLEKVFGDTSDNKPLFEVEAGARFSREDGSNSGPSESASEDNVFASLNANLSHLISSVRQSSVVEKKVKFSWYLVAYLLGEAMCKKIKFLRELKGDDFPAEDMIKSIIYFLQYAEKGYQQICEQTSLDDLKMEIFVMRIELTNEYLGRARVMEAARLFATVLKESSVTRETLKAELEGNIILNAINQLKAQIAGKLVNNINSKDGYEGLQILFSINAAMQQCFGLPCVFEEKAYKAMLNIFQEVILNVEYLGLKLSNADNIIIEKIKSEHAAFSETYNKQKNKKSIPEKTYELTPAVKDFQKLMENKAWNLQSLKQQSDAKFAQMTSELQSNKNLKKKK